MRICLDPGHPSEVGRGASGKKLTEVEAAWRVAKALERLLLELKHEVKLTKASEQAFVRNRKRAEIANAFRADLLLRLHCDSQGGTGFWTYFPDRQGTDATGKRGPSPEVIAASGRVAKPFHAGLAQGLAGALRDNGCHPDTRTAVGSKQGALTGSIWSEVPVVLVEMCVLSNPKDEAFLLSQKGQQQMARALLSGILAALN